MSSWSWRPANVCQMNSAGDQSLSSLSREAGISILLRSCSWSGGFDEPIFCTVESSAHIGLRCAPQRETCKALRAIRSYFVFAFGPRLCGLREAFFLCSTIRRWIVACGTDRTDFVASRNRSKASRPSTIAGFFIGAKSTPSARLRRACSWVQFEPPSVTLPEPLEEVAPSPTTRRASATGRMSPTRAPPRPTEDAHAEVPAVLFSPRGARGSGHRCAARRRSTRRAGRLHRPHRRADRQGARRHRGQPAKAVAGFGAVADVTGGCHGHRISHEERARARRGRELVRRSRGVADHEGVNIVHGLGSERVADGELPQVTECVSGERLPLRWLGRPER